MDLLDVVTLYPIFFYSNIKYPPYSKRIPMKLPLFAQSGMKNSSIEVEFC